MVYSGIYLLPKSNSSTIKSEKSSSNLSTANVTNNNVSNHLKHSSSKKLTSTGSTSNRSSESSRFNETNSNVTIKSDLNKFNKSPKLAPEIIFLIKEHAKTLETINQISKKLQEIELKVDDISQRLSKENSLNSFPQHHHHKPVVVNSSSQNDRISSDSTQQQKTTSNHQTELNQTSRLPAYSAYKDVDHLSNQNLSNNATNIPNNQILSDDSGGEYGNKTTTKTVSDDDELLSILEKITKCSHHILQTQQAYQQQGAAIYSSLSKPYAYNQQMSNQFNQFNQPTVLQPHQLTNASTVSTHHLHSSSPYHPDLYANLQQQPQNLYSAMNPYLLNAKSPIKTTSNHQQPNIHHSQQQQAIVPMKYTGAMPAQQTASLNELLFEPNVERFLNNLDQLVCNDDTNLAAILGNSSSNQHNQQLQATHLMNSPNLPNLLQQQHQQFIPVSPHHHQATPISSQPMPILMNNHLRSNCLNLSPNNYSNYNLGNRMINAQHSSIGQPQPYLNNVSLYDAASPNNFKKQQQQQYINLQKAKELLEKKDRERINNQLKQADEWLGMVDHCINRGKYQQQQQSTTSKQQSHSNASTGSKLLKGDKSDAHP